jgi:hypothetical protein
MAAYFFVGWQWLTEEAHWLPTKKLPARASYKRKARVPPKEK